MYTCTHSVNYKLLIREGVYDVTQSYNVVLRMVPFLIKLVR
jgi:hypothetical protein